MTDQEKKLLLQQLCYEREYRGRTWFKTLPVYIPVVVSEDDLELARQVIKNAYKPRQTSSSVFPRKPPKSASRARKDKYA